MVWLPEGEKKLKIVYSFWQNACTNVAYTRANRRTDTAWLLSPRLHSIAQQKMVIKQQKLMLKTSIGQLGAGELKYWRRPKTLSRLAQICSGCLWQHTSPLREAASSAAELASQAALVTYESASGQVTVTSQHSALPLCQETSVRPSGLSSRLTGTDPWVLWSLEYQQMQNHGRSGHSGRDV